MHELKLCIDISIVVSSTFDCVQVIAKYAL